MGHPILYTLYAIQCNAMQYRFLMKLCFLLDKEMMLQVGKKLEKMSMRQLEDWKEQSEELEAETALRQTVTAGYLFQILNCHLIVCL